MESAISTFPFNDFLGEYVQVKVKRLQKRQRPNKKGYTAISIALMFSIVLRGLLVKIIPASMKTEY